MRSWYLMLYGNVIGIIWGDDNARNVLTACNAPYPGEPYTIGWVDTYGGYMPGQPPLPSPAPRKAHETTTTSPAE